MADKGICWHDKKKILQILQLGNSTLTNNTFYSSPYSDFVKELQKSMEEMSSFDILKNVFTQKAVIPMHTYSFIIFYFSEQITNEELWRREEPPNKKIKLTYDARTR